MNIKQLQIDKKETIRTAIKRLEEVRCKVIYITEKGKLIGSISDGDIRRYVLESSDIDLEVSTLAKKMPIYLNHYEKEKINEWFSQAELYSIPIVNYNFEIMEVIFRDGRRIKADYHMNTPVVMMAGGKGTRLYPYTKILPKALVPVGDIPIAERIFDNFYSFGCEDMYMIINHKKEMIYSYFNSLRKRYKITYIEESVPLGTGGGLYLLENTIDKDFFLINCDILIDANYNEIYKYHCKKGNYITIVAAQYNYKIPYGVIGFDNCNNYIKMEEKPELNYYINTGMYIINKDLIKEMPRNQEISVPDLIENFKKKGKKIGVYTVYDSAYMDMGQLEELEKMKIKLNV